VEPVIVDTNIALVANKKQPNASPECVINCVRELMAIRKGVKKLVVDDNGLVFDEYRRNLSLSGEPGVGDLFVKWVHDYQYNSQRCDRVKITPIAGDDFAEFPQDPQLANFDRSDRKWVAISRVHPQNPPILNAVDSDWKNFESELNQHGITVDFVCPDFQFK
jgi:hypothetical protein